MTRALVRPPGADLAHCELTHLARAPIDLSRALRQHAGYCSALVELGCELVELPLLEGYGDACFVEDAVVVTDELAVLPVMGAPSRRPEQRTVAAALAPTHQLERLGRPALLDGGDVLRIGRELWVGLSSRTNRAAVEGLRELLGPRGYRVRAVRVRGCLHLKTALTWLGGGELLVNPAWVDVESLAEWCLVEVAEGEPFGANTLRVGGRLLISEGNPRTAELLGSRGYSICGVDIGEFEKAEAGVSCLSVLV